jgi:hypothetical protein
MENKAEMQTSSLHTKQKKETEESEVSKFIKAYEVKQHALVELGGIYAKNVLNPHFELTFKAAVAMLTLPSLTNIYYAIRPHSVLSGVMPFAVPLLCLFNYMYFMTKDFHTFCLSTDPDA